MSEADSIEEDKMANLNLYFSKSGRPKRATCSDCSATAKKRDVGGEIEIYCPQCSSILLKANDRDDLVRILRRATEFFRS
jgi:DNA-directed RNA polymerase subunit RPC12/RpoP